MDKDKKDFVIGSIILGILLFMLCSVIVIVLYKKELDSSLNNAISDYIVSDYVYVEKVDLSSYSDIYTGDLQIPKINLNNVSSDVKDKFNTNMNDIISNIDEVSSSLRSKIEGEYTPNSSISINMDYSIYNDILSVKYVIYINRDFDLGMYIDNIYLNYDLNNNKELSNKELLDKDNIDINTISTNIHVIGIPYHSWFIPINGIITSIGTNIILNIVNLFGKFILISPFDNSHNYYVLFYVYLFFCFYLIIYLTFPFYFFLFLT